MITSLRPMPSINKKDEIPFKKMRKYVWHVPFGNDTKNHNGGLIVKIYNDSFQKIVPPW
jgi:hypothetical protein